MAAEITINSDKALIAAIQELTEAYQQHRYLKVSYRSGKTRTLTQNRALHLYCRTVADALNDAGIEQALFFKAGYQVPWNDRTVKDSIWRTVQTAMTGETSTTKPETSHYPAIYEVVNRKLADHGIHVPWPTREAENAT